MDNYYKFNVTFSQFSNFVDAWKAVMHACGRPLAQKTSAFAIFFKSQFSRFTKLKVSVKENEVPTEKILVARVFSLQRQVIY